ncbi:MAG: DUF692 domain-containing protein [Thiotrichales bacterium]
MNTPTVTTRDFGVEGAGLGLRRELLSTLRQHAADATLGFMEIAPENWIHVGGSLGKSLRHFTERWPFVCHGLSLSLGGPAPLDKDFVRDIKQFLNTHQIRGYSEHLSYCSDDGHLYDLLPIPFTEEAVKHVASRIRRVQDILERQIAIENVSYYAAPSPELTEIEFINAVLAEADCALLLDVNNIYVNAVNHRYDALDYLRALPGDRIAYAHIAGHYNEADDLIVDTHGANVIEPVWALLDAAYAHFGVFPTLVERDFNIPPLAELLCEVRRIDTMQTRYATQRRPVERINA